MYSCQVSGRCAVPGYDARMTQSSGSNADESHDLVDLAVRARDAARRTAQAEEAVAEKSQVFGDLGIGIDLGSAYEPALAAAADLAEAAERWRDRLVRRAVDNGAGLIAVAEAARLNPRTVRRRTDELRAGGSEAAGNPSPR